MKITLQVLFQGQFGKPLKIEVKLILNCPRAIGIACLLQGQNSVQKETFKVLPSHKQVCKLLLKNTIAVEGEKPVMIVSKTQQIQFT